MIHPAITLLCGRRGDRPGDRPAVRPRPSARRGFARPGSTTARLATVAAILASALVLSGCASTAAPTPTSAQPKALQAGEYRAGAFQPTVTFTVPNGWYIAEDGADYFALLPVTSRDVGIYLFRSPGAASQDASCPTTALPEVGPTARNLVDWIVARPGFRTTPPTSVALGGLAGFQLDVAIKDGWTASCPFADGLPTVPMLVGKDGLRWVIAGSERLRLTVLDVPAGGTVVVDLDAFDGSLFDTFAPLAEPIVNSFRFAAL